MPVGADGSIAFQDRHKRAGAVYGNENRGSLATQRCVVAGISNKYARGPVPSGPFGARFDARDVKTRSRPSALMACLVMVVKLFAGERSLATEIVVVEGGPQTLLTEVACDPAASWHVSRRKILVFTPLVVYCLLWGANAS